MLWLQVIFPKSGIGVGMHECPPIKRACPTRERARPTRERVWPCATNARTCGNKTRTPANVFEGRGATTRRWFWKQFAKKRCDTWQHGQILVSSKTKTATEFRAQYPKQNQILADEQRVTRPTCPQAKAKYNMWNIPVTNNLFTPRELNEVIWNNQAKVLVLTLHTLDCQTLRRRSRRLISDSLRKEMFFWWVKGGLTWQGRTF